MKNSAGHSNQQPKIRIRNPIRTRQNQILAVLAIVVVGLLGVYLLSLSHAVTPTSAFEPETGTLANGAVVASNTSASGGKAVKFGSSATSQLVLIGMYNGNPNESPDEGYKSAMGVWPEVASTYITTQAINQTYEKARVSHGTAAFLDLDSKSTAGMIGDVANQTTTGMNYINTFLTAAESVATSTASAKVYVSFVHEWEVKKDQGVLTDANDTNTATFAKALKVFYNQAASIAPHTKTVYWVGGSDTTLIAQVMADMTVAPDAVSYDPYVTKAANYVSMSTKLSAGANFFKNNTSYKSWGSVPIFVTETGVDTSHGDANCADYYTNMRTTLRSLGLSGVIQFNRDKTDNNGAVVAYKITSGSFPQCVNAFINSLAQS